MLILSIAKQFWKILSNKQRYPSYVMSFHKRDLLNIETIGNRNVKDKIAEVNLNCISNYLSKLEFLGKDVNLFNYFYVICYLKLLLYVFLELNRLSDYLERVRIENLSSLKSLSLTLDSIEESYFRNLNSLRILRLDVNRDINNEFSTRLFVIFPKIEELHLHGQFSNINFDSFVNLKKLSLYGILFDDFNFDVFDNICNQLKEINVKLENMNDESFTRLFYGRNFSNLFKFNIVSSKITRSV